MNWINLKTVLLSGNINNSGKNHIKHQQLPSLGNTAAGWFMIKMVFKWFFSGKLSLLNCSKTICK